MYSKTHETKSLACHKSFPPQVRFEPPIPIFRHFLWLYAYERSAGMLGNRGSGDFYLTSQQRTRSKNRITSDCFFFWISSTYLRAPIWTIASQRLELNDRKSFVVIIIPCRLRRRLVVCRNCKKSSRKKRREDCVWDASD